MTAAYYSCAVRSPAPLTGAPYVTLHTGTAKRAYVIYAEAAISATTQSLFGLARPANAPVATTSVLGQADDPSFPASTVRLDTAWSTAPTVSGGFLRRGTTPSAVAVGFGFAWTWSLFDALVVPPSSYLVLWNPGAATAAACDVSFRWYEEV